MFLYGDIWRFVYKQKTEGRLGCISIVSYLWAWKFQLHKQNSKLPHSELVSIFWGYIDFTSF